MKTLKNIYINIWDDFLDNADIDLYLEMDMEEDSLTKEDGYNILDYVQSCLDIYLPAISHSINHTYDNEFPRLDLNSISHNDIESIIKVLNNKTYKNYTLLVYSES